MSMKYNQMCDETVEVAYVFGGAGYIGYELCKELARKYNSVVCLDVNEEVFPEENITHYPFDILKSNSLPDDFAQGAHVYYLSGLSDLNEGASNPVRTVELNILGLTRVLSLLVNFQNVQFFYFSSIYADGLVGSFYGASKEAAENYIKIFAKQNSNLSYNILRLGSVYGGRVDERNGLYKIALAALRGDEKWYFGDPNTSRDYIHVLDLCAATISLCAAGASERTYLVTGNRKYKIEEVCYLLEEIIEAPHLTRVEPKYSLGHYVKTPYRLSEKPMVIYLNETIDFGWALREYLENLKNV